MKMSREANKQAKNNTDECFSNNQINEKIDE